MRWIYVLLLEQNKWYVGFTENLEQRMTQHFSGEGSKWTQIYKPIKIAEVKLETNNWQEDFTTLIMMRKYGIDNVRGGSWCQSFKLDFVPPNYDKIDPNLSMEENMFLISKNTCKRNEIKTEETTLKLFKEGKNEFQISLLRGMTLIEVEKHIIDLIKINKISKDEIGLTLSKILQIETSIKKINKDNRSLLTIKSICDRNITASDIRYYLALNQI